MHFNVIPVVGIYSLSSNNWFSELFQDLSQLQEIWIAEGECNIKC